MKIYTKTGDEGRTKLYGGDPVFKDDPRVAAYGTLDELNAALGFALALDPDSRLRPADGAALVAELEALTGLTADLQRVGSRSELLGSVSDNTRRLELAGPCSVGWPLM